MGQNNSRKRKRVAEVSPGRSSVSEYDGDVIHVAPRPAVADKDITERAPLAETHTRGNRARRARTAQLVHVDAPSIHTGPPTPLQATHDADQVIPPDCCYFCLTRGGNAAYECHTEEGADLCTRCIRDKKKKCRLPTPEESAAIAARCPRCTIRGFKQCDGSNPCDTCIRNKTTHLCRKLPEKKKAKLEELATRSEMIPQSEGVAPEQSSRSRRTRRSEVRQTSNEVQATTEDVSDAVDHNTTRNGTSRSKRRKILSNSTPDEYTQVASPKPSPSRSSLRKASKTPENPADENEELHGGHDALPSPVTSNDLALEDDPKSATAAGDEDVPMMDNDSDQGREVNALNIGRSGRSSRARPRVSYVEHMPDDLSDHGLGLAAENEDVSDIYTSPTTDDEEESEAEIEPASSDEEASGMSDAESLDVSFDEDVIPVENDQPKPNPRRNTKTGESTRAGKGIDLSLPPLSNIQECMFDMTAKAVNLGLCEALQSLGERPIRVATMCSGTESPLLALDEISKALERMGKPPMYIQQEFSAEIEIFKQGYIERNFAPKKLFRDVRDFLHKDTTTAITAYGAEVEIPTGIDMLIAGFVCKDLSRMNNKGKALDDRGESGDTWEAIRTYAERFRPSIVLIENVKNEKKTWDDVVQRWSKIGYEAQWIYCDTKNYYLPQTRERMYMIAVERSHLGKDVKRATHQWKELMQKLERQCSSPYEAFLPESLKESSGYSSLKNEPDWALCKLRNDHIRSEKRLGILSPVSRRSDNGTVVPPDFADRKFYNSQSSRVHDAIDIAHLEFAALKGCDSLYKMALWDVSQNVDRFKADLGIAPCLTPGGQDFASNRQHTLNGSQLLILQGMPLDRLMFANETQKDLQNLAGNAMSTTVIGASLLSALIAGSQAFRSEYNVTSDKASCVPPASIMVTHPEILGQTILEPSTCGDLDLVELQQEAKLSARMCNCEGRQLISKNAIQLCSACEHTACTSCAGNPRHVYEAVISTQQRKLQPDEFIRRWRPKLPPRLKLKAFPNIYHLASELGAKDTILSQYLTTVSEAHLGSQYFCIDEFSREYNEWRITYSSPRATVELKVGFDIQWSLFVKCPPSLPGNSRLREFLRNPIAQSNVADDLFGVEWKVRMPSTSNHTLNVSGSIEKVNSWRSRLGLVDFKEETVPKTIKILGDHQELAAIIGDYEYQPHCGTASTSLYKRSTDSDSMYLFLDPNPIGRSDHDSFVFSQDNTRKHYGDSRITLAQVDPAWRPWHVKDGCVHAITTKIQDVWVSVSMQLESAGVPLEVGFLEEERLLKIGLPSCSQALTCLDVFLHDQFPVQDFADYSWALECAKRLPTCSSWQPTHSESLEHCSCAPSYPNILWSVDEKGVAMAHEDRQAAATFERAIKQRPAIFQLEASSDATGTRVRVGVDVMSLVHRAKGRLPKSTSTTTAWRLITDHADLPSQSFAKFRLQSNVSDTQSSLAILPNYLRGAQLKTVSWMLSQELGRVITIYETEESIHPGLGWRAEARVEMEQTVCGGVLADQPSFGKTVASIGLIQSEFDQISPEKLLERNQDLACEQPQLLDSAATLVVCPPHITEQWNTELEKFLGSKKYEEYDVLVIESCSQLKSLTVDDLHRSKVIVVSWTLFADEAYISELAKFAALPEPIMTSRRAFNCWMKRAVGEIPSQLEVYQHHPYNEFQRVTKELMNERLQHREFQATLPISIQHGSAYQSFSNMKTKSVSSNNAKAKSVTKTRQDSSSHLTPLLHLFRFNRIIVDEYHYLNDTNKIGSNFIATSIKQISAHKRWVLSGTPALANFSDVNQLASFLGVKLGRYFCGDGSVTTSAEKMTKLDQTDVESFLSQTEVMSRQWHVARHRRAQEFLDDFVRQNEAELQHIDCSEKVLSVDLDAAHHAVYLELSQYLISQKMQIKKLNKKSGSDRSTRLNDSLENSASAEEALLRCALLFETEEGRSALELLIEKRSQQLRNTKKELLKSLAKFEGLMKKSHGTEATIRDLYGHFKKDISQYNWLGDDESSQIVRSLIKEAQKTPRPGLTDVSNMSKVQRERLIKQELSQLRDTSLELAHRARSRRFVVSIRDHLKLVRRDEEPVRCSLPGCNGVADIQLLFLIPHCGHTACKECLGSRTDDEACIHPGCNSNANESSLIRMADLGSSKGQHEGQGFGNKLEAIAQLILDIPEDDQGIVFAPNEEIIGILETVFDHYEISYHSPGRNRHKASAAKLMEDFKTNTNVKKRKKLIILNLGSESAAGVNLTIANHVIFVSPFLAKTQYEYDSAMAQAIARSRRYGQQKKVHIYHVIAQRTIDVDILEHRHRRSDAITTMDATTVLPETCSTKKEKTKLAKNRKGDMILAPLSWLADEAKRRAMDVEDSTEKFTSLINFSETFEQEDDEP